LAELAQAGLPASQQLAMHAMERYNPDDRVLTDMAQEGFPIARGFVIRSRDKLDDEGVAKAILSQARTLASRRKLMVRSSPEINLPDKLVPREIANLSVSELIPAIQKIREAWNSAATREYRQKHNLPADGELPVIIQVMPQGDKNEKSASGVFITSDPLTGNNQPARYFDLQMNSAKIAARDSKTLLPIERLPETRDFPPAYRKLCEMGAWLEKRYGQTMAMEFVIEDGKLFVMHVYSSLKDYTEPVENPLEEVVKIP
jgi:hypothetical protein